MMIVAWYVHPCSDGSNGTKVPHDCWSRSSAILLTWIHDDAFTRLLSARRTHSTVGDDGTVCVFHSVCLVSIKFASEALRIVEARLNDLCSNVIKIVR